MSSLLIVGLINQIPTEKVRLPHYVRNDNREIAFPLLDKKSNYFIIKTSGFDKSNPYKTRTAIILVAVSNVETRPL